MHQHPRTAKPRRPRDRLGAWLRRLLGTPAASTASGAAARGGEQGHPAAAQFSGEMFARLLRELPAHRHEIAAAWHAGDLRRLQDHVHRLLGATVYCDAPELETALRDLRRALQARDRAVIGRAQAHTLRVIDSTLQASGLRRGG